MRSKLIGYGKSFYHERLARSSGFSDNNFSFERFDDLDVSAAAALFGDGAEVFDADPDDAETTGVKLGRPLAVRRADEAARDKARAIAKNEAYAVSRRERKKVEMPFAHLKRILRLDRLRLRGPSGAKDEFLSATPPKSPGN